MDSGAGYLCLVPEHTDRKAIWRRVALRPKETHVTTKTLNPNPLGSVFVVAAKVNYFVGLTLLMIDVMFPTNFFRESGSTSVNSMTA